MKYTDGYWLKREGVEEMNAIEVYDYRIEDKTLILYCPFKSIQSKGDTLNLGMLTIEVFAPRNNIIGVKTYHHIGDCSKKHSFDLCLEDCEVEIIVNDDNIHYIAGLAEAVISLEKENFYIDFYYDHILKTRSFSKSMAYVLFEGKGYIKEELQLDIGEYIYGLGERFTPFIKNGQTVIIDNKDGGTGSEQSYKNVPFYCSNKGYGIFVNTPDIVEFEIASEKVSRVQFSVQDECLEYYFCGGKDLKETMVNYTSLTHKPGMPPAWSFGLWLSTSFVTDYDENTVMEFIDGMLERDIPLDVFHFDCCWMDEFEWCNFEWNKKTFPDPEGLISRIHDKGIKVCVWINPYIAQKSKLFKIGMENGYFLKNKDGSVWQWDLWQSGLAVVDFTNPDATSWYLSYLDALLDMGVDCFKTDFGERIPKDVVYFDHSNARVNHNYYAYLYNKAVFDLLERRLGKEQAVVFARSATATCQQFPVHWGGDCVSTYASMAESLRGGLSFTLSGFGFWSHDIGGFEDGCEADLYKRWTQFGLLSTHSRYHGSGQYKVPWYYGDEAVEVTRIFTKLKLSLMPYLYTQARYTHETGIPMVRPMVLEFYDDPVCATLDTQYMLGSQLLVAPIFNKEGYVRYYVPKGVWTNYFTNKTYEGPMYVEEEYDYFSMPLLVRENTVLVTNPDAKHASYAYNRDCHIKLYQIHDNVSTEVSLIDGTKADINVIYEDGNIKAELSNFEGECTIEYDGEIFSLQEDEE